MDNIELRENEIENDRPIKKQRNSYEKVVVALLVGRAVQEEECALK